ncbi:Transcription factor SOX-7 [Termitomyces sp. J132]|nr:Transcription factor SOX-7 [Termitomyces sp. J132]
MPATKSTCRRSGKKLSEGYIPRPMNSFMLFRQHYCSQNHIPSIRTNSDRLSAILGKYWKNLPLQEKKIWKDMAKEVKEQHMVQYPNYRYRPVHNKNKPKKKKSVTNFEEGRRYEEISHLVNDKKSNLLAMSGRKPDAMHTQTPPNVPSIPCSPSNFPLISISQQQQQRMLLGECRAANDLPALSAPVHRPCAAMPHQRGDLPLPTFNASLFNPSFHNGVSNFPLHKDAQYMTPLSSFHDRNFTRPDCIASYGIPLNLIQQQHMNNSVSPSPGLPELYPRLLARPSAPPSVSSLDGLSRIPVVLYLPIPAAAPEAQAIQSYLAV